MVGNSSNGWRCGLGGPSGQSIAMPGARFFIFFTHLD